jgi:DNA repair exonuclease SbcCD ATPase subunit
VQKKNRIVLLALAALALPAAVSAQTTPAPAPAPAQQPAASAQAEIQQIQQRLAQLQQQALQSDSAARAAEATFGADLMAAMQQLDPTTQAKAARGEALNQEVEAAQAANDNARLTALATEAQGLQAFFAGLSQRALATPEMQEKRRAFLAVLLARMNQIDPQAQALVARLETLRSGGAAPAAQPQQ